MDVAIDGQRGAKGGPGGVKEWNTIRTITKARRVLAPWFGPGSRKARQKHFLGNL